MDQLMNQIKQLANFEGVQRSYLAPCIITHYDPILYRVKVRLVPTEVETGWVPMASWGEIMPPRIDSQAFLVFLRGDINSGIVVGNVFSKAEPPPQDAEVTLPGSFLLQTDNGAEIKITNSGKIQIKAVSGQEAVLHSDANVLAGNKSEGFQRLVKETLKDLYNDHTHAANGVPTAALYQITDDNLTDVLKGN